MRRGEEASTYLEEVAWFSEGVRVVHHVGKRGTLAEGKLLIVHVLKEQQPRVEGGVEKGPACEHGEVSGG